MNDERGFFKDVVVAMYYYSVATHTRWDGRVLPDETVKRIFYRFDPEFAKAYIAWIDAGRALRKVLEKRYERQTPETYGQPVAAA